MARATVVSGTVVRSRTAPTTFSTVSAACTVQSWAAACGMAAHYPPRSVRLALALVAGAAAAALAALILGEYELVRSEEHTSELQSRLHLVCRLLLEKKKIKNSI